VLVAATTMRDGEHEVLVGEGARARRGAAPTTVVADGAS
jgi:hypothetical protein